MARDARIGRKRQLGTHPTCREWSGVNGKDLVPRGLLSELMVWKRRKGKEEGTTN